MRKSLISEIQSQIAKLAHDGWTEDRIAQKSGLSKGTIRKFRSADCNTQFRPTIMTRAQEYFLGEHDEDDEFVARYIEKKLGMNEHDKSRLKAQICKDYLAFRLITDDRQFIISHISVELPPTGAVRFNERFRLPSPSFSERKFEEYNHSGFVFHRKNYLYFWNVAHSNLRTISLQLWGSNGFERAVGATLGRDVFGAATTQTLLITGVKMPPDEIEGHISTYTEAPEMFKEAEHYLRSFKAVRYA